jgi:uncharacterized protein DUF4349
MEDRLQSLATRFRALAPARRGLLYAAGLVLVLLLLVVLAPNRNVTNTHPQNAVTGNGKTSNLEAFSPDKMAFPDVDARRKEMVASMSPSAAYRGGAVDMGGAPGEPRIAYSAEIGVATKEFVHSRACLEEILERHRGYVAKLRMVGQPAGSQLSATLRIPSSEYSSALSDLKSIGRVEHEEESADEVTQQHGDLEARLINAQNTEQRLQKIIQNPAKGSDMQVFERQLAGLRAEIEHMQAERQAFENRSVFSSVFFSMREEIASPAVTFGAQLRSAAVNGFSDAAGSLSSMLIFAMNYGPSLLLWAAILFLPARFVWRRARLLTARTSA